MKTFNLYEIDARCKVSPEAPTGYFHARVLSSSIELAIEHFKAKYQPFEIVKVEKHYELELAE
jgi:hypothetical protein